MKHLRDRTLPGIRWSGAAQVARQALQFGISVVLARELGPHDFGLMGMIVVVSGAAGLLAEFGLGSTLVQRRNLDDRHLSCVFWVNVASGVTLTALFVIGAPFIARIYREPALRPLTMTVALNSPSAR